jgi:hypothetical protein
MKRLFKVTVGFFRTLGSCVEKAASDTEQHYYIPKSRFRDHDPAGFELTEHAGQGNIARFRAFVHTLRNCISTAWQESDRQYYLPKTRFRDAGGKGRGRQPSILVPTRRMIDPAGPDALIVRPEHPLAGSAPAKEAWTGKTVYADPVAETFNPPRWTEE